MCMEVIRRVGSLLNVNSAIFEDEGPGVYGLHLKLLIVWVRDMETWGYQGRAGVKDGKDGDEDDQVDVSCFLEIKTAQHRTVETWARIHESVIRRYDRP